MAPRQLRDARRLHYLVRCVVERVVDVVGHPDVQTADRRGGRQHGPAGPGCRSSSTSRWPFDSGATYRPGTRFGPQGIRRSTNLFGTYNYETGVDLREQLNMIDIGDVFTIPGNLEKSFDQISQAMAHVVQKGVMPVILGGDHSIGFPTIPGHGALSRRQRRHHPLRPARRHPGNRPRRADAHHALVPRHQHQERARHQPGADRHRRVAGAAGRG